MSSTEPLTVQTFAQELGELIRRYLLTFDPAAPTELQHINLAVHGKNLGLQYTEQGGEPPALVISMTKMERVSTLPPISDPMVNAPDEARKQGLFGGRG